jgi:hypothetical protein
MWGPVAAARKFAKQASGASVSARFSLLHKKRVVTPRTITATARSMKVAAVPVVARTKTARAMAQEPVVLVRKTATTMTSRFIQVRLKFVATTRMTIAGVAINLVATTAASPVTTTPNRVTILLVGSRS